MALGPFSKQDHLQITTLGLEFAVSEILCVWAGFWADKKLGSFPWGVVAGAAVGFALGFYQILRAAKQMAQDNAKLKKAEQKDGRR